MPITHVRTGSGEASHSLSGPSVLAALGATGVLRATSLVLFYFHSLNPSPNSLCAVEIPVHCFWVEQVMFSLDSHIV